MSKFKDWFKKTEDDHDLYNYPEEAMEEAWNAALDTRPSSLRDKVAELESENDKLRGWHDVIKQCEEILGCLDTADSPLMSNLPNLIRDKLAIIDQGG